MSQRNEWDDSAFADDADDETVDATYGEDEDNWDEDEDEEDPLEDSEDEDLELDDEDVEEYEDNWEGLDDDILDLAGTGAVHFGPDE